jgi:hypothetical protein
MVNGGASRADNGAAPGRWLKRDDINFLLYTE